MGTEPCFFVIGPLTAFGVGMAMFRGHLLCSFRLQRERIAELFRHVEWYALSGGIGNLVGRMDLFILSASASLGSAVFLQRDRVSQASHGSWQAIFRLC